MLIQSALDFSAITEYDYSVLPPNISYFTDSIPQAVIRNISEQRELCIDIETYGDLPWSGLCHWDGNIRTIQIATRGFDVYVFDLLKLPTHTVNLLQQVLIAVLADPKVKIIAHNIMFELTWMFHHFDTREAINLMDTMIMSTLLYNGVRGQSSKQPLSHSLKACMAREIDYKMDKTEQTSTWGQANLTPSQIEYAATDVSLLFKLYDKLHAKISECRVGNVVRIECECIAAFAQMQVDGIPIDIELTKKALQYHQDLLDKQAEIFDKDFPNLGYTGSTLNTAIYEYLDSKDYDFSSLNEYWDNRRIRQASAKDGFDSVALSICKDGYPALEALHEIRSIEKHVNYLENMLACERNGCIYSSYRSITATSLGRTTSSAFAKMKAKEQKQYDLKPAALGMNLQNPPKAYNKESTKLGLSIRHCIKMDVISDYMACHNLIAVQLANDTLSIEIANNGGDIHLYTAASVEAMNGGTLTFDDMMAIKKDENHPEYSRVKKLRSLAKAVRYSSFNLGGSARLQATLADQGMEFSIEECKAAIKAWRETHAPIYNLQMRLVTMANNQNIKFPDSPYTYGRVINHLGGIMHFPKMESKFSKYPSVSASDVCSFSWMSVEAYAMKKALMRCYRTFLQNPHWEARIVNMCHDELNAVCKEEYRDIVAKTVFEHMDDTIAEHITLIPTNESTYEDCKVRCLADK